MLPATFDSPFSVPYRHRVLFTQHCLDGRNPSLATLLAEPTPAPRRAIALVDGGVADAWPTLTHDLERTLRAFPDMPELCCVERTAAGEATKQDDRTAQRVVQLVDTHKIDRQSYVLSIGGGAVQDAVGYGAAIAHRGCRLVRIATTTLAQGDAAMAVKNGINTGGKKNFTGTFSVPWGVVCDTAFLPTLPAWAWAGGFSEAVKIALLRSADFFAQIERAAPQIAARNMEAALPVIHQSGLLHYRHIVTGGDPFETRSARPLDYGHWLAHRLEALTHGQLAHGQAVSIGVAVDTLYSACAGMLPMSEAHRVLHTLHALGLPVSHALLADAAPLAAGLEEFREHLGGRLTLTLLTGIGAPVDVHQLDHALLARAARMAVDFAAAQRSR